MRNMEEDKCDNCKFKDSSAWMPPCFGCGYGYNNFESANPSETMIGNYRECGDATRNHPEFLIMGSLCSNRGFRTLAGWDVIGAV